MAKFRHAAYADRARANKEKGPQIVKPFPIGTLVRMDYDHKTPWVVLEHGQQKLYRGENKYYTDCIVRNTITGEIETHASYVMFVPLS